MQRAVLFSFYDEQGIIDEYVFFFLKELRKFVEITLFYSNGPLAKRSEIALQGAVDEIIIRKNEGFDVWAHKEGLERIGFDKLAQYDEILMVNHTCYGPIFPFSELFSEMEKRDCDFWGVTAHKEVIPNPFTRSGALPYHINANFIGVRKTMLKSPSFRRYWESMIPPETYEDAVLAHESRFTKHFTDLGYKASTYRDMDRYGSHYPLIINIDDMVRDRVPIIKRRAFFHDPRFLEHNGVDVAHALRIMKATSDYDERLIWNNVLRSSELRNLNTNASLTSILSDVRAKQDNANTVGLGEVAVCAHIYYVDMLPEILALTANISVPYDFIATTSKQSDKDAVEKILLGHEGVRKVIVRVVEQNRGRDMSALFISCRDLLLDSTYEVVCRLHTKRSPQVPAARGNLFKRHMFDNLLNSPGYVNNVLDMFHDHPWIGVAVPPIVHISYSTMGHAWYANRQKAVDVARLLGLNVAFDPDTPVAAYGTMFWFRPRALRKLFEHEWKWEDFNAEPHHIDGGLAHALERLITYAAQDAGYTTQQILCAHSAGQNYAMLEYKLQKLCATLPLSDFNWHAHFLEQWKLAGYPLGEYASVSQAAKALGLTLKRSLAFRAPLAFRILKQLSRAFRFTLSPPRRNGAV